ncbi:MAG: stage II sporulation protein M [Planctomycetia bacterium]|nr:stage II sporulation protein M [Planctomycetia bacterium]
MKKNTPLDTMIQIQTPENVEITYFLAGMPLRLLAYILDIFFSYMLFSLVTYMASYLNTFFNINWGDLGFSFILAFYFILSWGYWIICEGCFNGKTPGKHILGLRVISVNGAPITLTHSLIRNLMRAVDCQPMILYQMGFWSMFVTGTSQRLGDLAAGTIVIQQKREIPPKSLLNSSLRTRQLLQMLPSDLRLTDSLRKTLTFYMIRRKDLTPARCQVLAFPLAQRVAEMYHLPPYADPDSILCAVYERYVYSEWKERELSHDLQAKDAFWGSEEQWKRYMQENLPGMDRRILPPPPTPSFEKSISEVDAGVLSFLHAKIDVWKSLEVLCRRAGSFFRRLSRKERLRLAADYRSTESDLSMSEFLHLEPRTKTFLESLLGNAYQILYRASSHGLGYWGKKFFVETPRLLFTDSYLWSCMFLFCGFFFGTMWMASTQKDFAEKICSAEMLEAVKNSYSKPVESHYEDSLFLGKMTGFYIFNNTTIGIRCFALGILGGITGILMMLYQAVFLGAIFGYMNTTMYWDNFLTFVTAHGPCELTAVVLGTAAGARIGFSLIATHGYRRTDAVRKAAFTAMPVAILFILLFFIAAFIEGFISPSSLPYYVKLSVAILSSIIMGSYFFILGGLSFLFDRQTEKKEK